MKLEPCPFCANKPSYSVNHELVYCRTKDCPMNAIGVGAERWQKRTLPPAVQEVERCVYTLRMLSSLSRGKTLEEANYIIDCVEAEIREALAKLDAGREEI